MIKREVIHTICPLEATSIADFANIIAKEYLPKKRKYKDYRFNFNDKYLFFADILSYNGPLYKFEFICTKLAHSSFFYDALHSLCSFNSDLNSAVRFLERYDDFRIYYGCGLDNALQKVLSNIADNSDDQNLYESLLQALEQGNLGKMLDVIVTGQSRTN